MITRRAAWLGITAALIVTPVAATGPSACSASSRAAMTPLDLTTVATELATTQTQPEVLARRIAACVILMPDTPIEAEWTWSGVNPKAGILAAKAWYQIGATPGVWEFVQMHVSFVPPDSDVPALYRKLLAHARQTLGPPRVSRGEPTAVAWSLSGNRTLTIDMDPPVPSSLRPATVQIEIAVQEGEADNPMP